MRRLYTRDELTDNFAAVITVLVAGGLWSTDVRAAIDALARGFGLKLELPHAATTTTVDALPEQSGSVNAEAARLLAAMMRLAQKERVEREAAL